MKLYSENKNYKLYHGSMLDMLEHIEPNSIDSVVTDPPYELNFMNKGWDNAGVSFQPDTWKRCYEVLKPGGYLLAFGGSRTFHRIAVAIEDAGFEIRDTIMWIYGSGFPKSMNIGLAIDKKNGAEVVLGNVKPGHSDFVGRTTDGDTKFKDGMSGFDRPWMHDSKKRESYHYDKVLQTNEAKKWEGWGSCLKPSFEPIIVARKPLEGTLVDNVLTYSVGGLNIDECRVPANPGEYDIRHYTKEDCFQNLKPKESKFQVKPQPAGRFPANTILTYDDNDYDEVCGRFPDSGKGNNGIPYNYAGREYNNKETSMFNGDKPQAPSNYNDSGSASRYFYCAKASKKDRDEGLDKIESRKKNTHPTVKPTELMQYLIRLVTPNGGTILDPFNGSGSTGKAAMYENRERNKDYKYIGIELTEEYLPIAKARIEYPLTCVLHNDKKETKVTKQVVAEQNKEVSLW